MNDADLSNLKWAVYTLTTHDTKDSEKAVAWTSVWSYLLPMMIDIGPDLKRIAVALEAIAAKMPGGESR